MKWAIYEMSLFLNSPFFEMSIYEMSIYEMSIYEMSLKNQPSVLWMVKSETVERVARICIAV